MKRLLVVLTPSPASRFALVEAIAFAKKNGARVRLIRVANVFGVAARRRADAWLNEMAEAVPPDLRDGAFTVFGRAPEAIVRCADDYEADGVVLAARTYRALTRMLRPGSTFDECLEPKLIVVWKPRPSSPPAFVPAATVVEGRDRSSRERARSSLPR